MSNLDDPNNLNDRLSDKPSESEAIQMEGEELHNLFLQDISDKKISSQVTDQRPSQITLLEAIFDATIIRAISTSVSEFKLFGANLINKSVLLGLSRGFGQAPFFAARKGEIKELNTEKTIVQRLAEIAKQKQIEKDKSQTAIKTESKEKIKKKEVILDVEIDDLKPSEKDLIVENLEPETIQNQDMTDELSNKRYNITESISKATELELSMLKPEQHHKGLGQKLEHSSSADLGGNRSSDSSPVLSIDRLKQCIQKFSSGKILVLGDLLIDELLEGRPERISREAPVLILEHVDTTLIPGGAANTAHNVTALGGKCHAIGICGNDDYANKLKQLLDKQSIEHSLVVDPDRPTTVKTRILSKTHALMQQLLRLDRISHKPIDKNIETGLIANIEKVSKEYPIFILSDYRGGLITDEIIHTCKKLAAKQELMLIVDAQDQFERYQNVALLTPNQPDTERAIGYKINSQAELLQAGEDMLMFTGAQSVLITRGKEGMALFSRGSEPFMLPALNRSEVYDVSGAGDTVVATIALALATGASLPEAMALGNIAAGIVVTKPGTAVTSQKEMLDLLPLIKLPS